jgi:glycerophosphoryl diester phosphodiesterase
MTTTRGSVWNEVPLVVGHRGGRGEGWPRENTLAAFEQARAQGARAIELDVRTWQGEVIVLHDPPDAPLAELRPEVPLLAEALAWAERAGVAVNVEMKHDVEDLLALARATLRLVRESAADVLLSSFDPRLLAMAAALAPGVPRALLVHRAQGRWAAAMQEVVRPPIVEAIHLERTQTDPRSIARYLRRGLRVGAWTVNDPGEAADLVALGVATVITDMPGQIRAALASRTLTDPAQ